MANTINPMAGSVAQLLGNPDSSKHAKDPSFLSPAQQQAQNKANELLSKQSNDAFLPSAKGMQAAASIEKYQNTYAYSQTMSMSLTTQEGDTVKVDFRQLYAQYQEYKREQMTEEGPKGVRMFESREALEATAFEEKFAFSVEGDLNENELKAVFDVFEQVDNLANEFFNGNIEKAFEKAQELKIDYGQLKTFSLDLQKTESRSTSYQQAAAYKGVQQSPAEGTKAEQEGGQIADLPPYLQKWQDVISRLDEQFANARTAFDELMAGAAAQRFPEQDTQQGWFERIRSFHDTLADAAKLDKVTLAPSGVEIDTKVITPEAKPEIKADVKSDVVVEPRATDALEMVSKNPAQGVTEEAPRVVQEKA